MSTFPEFVAATQELFGLYGKPGRGVLNKNYIDVSARFTRHRLGSDAPASHGEAQPETMNPVTFLDGANKRNDRARVTIVVGQYGLGKTELVFQVCRRLLQLRSGSPVPLPINLASCRKEFGALSDKSSPKELAKILFGRTEADGVAIPVIELWRAIRTHHAILVLDGVDELLSRWTDLRRLLGALVRAASGNEPDDSSFHLVLTMRLELLQAMGKGKEDGEELAAAVSSAVPGLAVDSDFLQLGFLQDSQVCAYLRLNLPDGDDVFDKLTQRKALMDMVRRPLLLRILCDLMKEPGCEPLSLLKMQQPADLVSAFVDRALTDPALVQDQENINAAFQWRKARIATRSLMLYENGRNDLDLDDIKDILGVKNAAGRPSKAAEDIVSGIHKLPFLQLVDGRSGTTLVQFAHRIFFEYFVALGMRLTEGTSEFSAFDRLVLNVDMRKFLYGLMGETKWYKRTRRSYALERKQWGEWKALGLDADLGLCEQHRRILLASMTDPERYAREGALREQLEATIHWFLGSEKEFHPRYLAYNYEAVAVYLAYQRWTATAKAARELLGRILANRLAAASKTSGRHATCADAWELVVERALSIGLRLRYDWIGQMARADWSKVIRDENTLSRIKAIREDVVSSDL